MISRSTPRPRPAAALAFRPELQAWLFPPPAWDALNALVDIVTPPLADATWRDHRDALAKVEVLIGGWGIPVLDDAFLAAAPSLRVVLYGAGSVKGWTTPAFWARNIPVSTAASANAAPTATFAEAMIILALKQTWFYLRENRADWAYLSDTASSGVHGATIGLVGIGRVARELIRGLRRHEVTLLAADPTLRADDARALGLELVDLPTLFSRSDVVSLHAPVLPETVGLIGADLLRRMKPHASFLNTARGALVREPELVTVLRERPDLTAILDVTDPEPAPADSPLRALPNVVLTPHLAGARHREIELAGRVVLAELRRWLAGEPLQWPITAAEAARQA